MGGIRTTQRASPPACWRPSWPRPGGSHTRGFRLKGQRMPVEAVGEPGPHGSGGTAWTPETAWDRVDWRSDDRKHPRRSRTADPTRRQRRAQCPGTLRPLGSGARGFGPVARPRALDRRPAGPLSQHRSGVTRAGVPSRARSRPDRLASDRDRGALARSDPLPEDGPPVRPPLRRPRCFRRLLRSRSQIPAASSTPHDSEPSSRLGRASARVLNATGSRSWRAPCAGRGRRCRWCWPGPVSFAQWPSAWRSCSSSFGSWRPACRSF